MTLLLSFCCDLWLSLHYDPIIVPLLWPHYCPPVMTLLLFPSWHCYCSCQDPAAVPLLLPLYHTSCYNTSTVPVMTWLLLLCYDSCTFPLLWPQGVPNIGWEGSECNNVLTFVHTIIHFSVISHLSVSCIPSSRITWPDKHVKAISRLLRWRNHHYSLFFISLMHHPIL